MDWDDIFHVRCLPQAIHNSHISVYIKFGRKGEISHEAVPLFLRPAIGGPSPTTSHTRPPHPKQLPSPLLLTHPTSILHQLLSKHFALQLSHITVQNFGHCPCILCIPITCWLAIVLGYNWNLNSDQQLTAETKLQICMSFPVTQLKYDSELAGGWQWWQTKDPCKRWEGKTAQRCKTLC